MTTTLRQAGQPNPSSWLDRHGDYLYRYAIFRVRDAMVAEDLLQETLLAALKEYSSFRGASSEKTWLVGILRHKILDRFREMSRTQALHITEDPIDKVTFEEDGHWKSGAAPLAWQPDPYELVERKEFWEVLSQALSSLPARTATAFILREIDRLGTDEICDALNVTPENLTVMLHRARIALRGFLQVNWFATPAGPSRTAEDDSSRAHNHAPLPTSVSFAPRPRLTA